MRSKILSLIVAVIIAMQLVSMPVYANDSKYMSEETAIKFLKFLTGEHFKEPEGSEKWLLLLQGFFEGTDEEEKLEETFIQFAYRCVDEDIYTNRLDMLKNSLEEDAVDYLTGNLSEVIKDEVAEEIRDEITNLGTLNDVIEGFKVALESICAVILINDNNKRNYFISTIGTNPEDEYDQIMREGFAVAYGVSAADAEIVDEWTEYLYYVENKHISKVEFTEAAKYNIEFNSNCSEVESVSYIYDTSERNWYEPTMEREGYVFAGWYWDQACTKSAAGMVVVNKDTVFYAKWLDRYHTVKFDSNCAYVSDYVYVYDITKQNWYEPTMTRGGYIFEGWYWDSTCTNSAAGEVTVNRDLTFYAKWAQQYSYTVSNGEATITGLLGFESDNGVVNTNLSIPYSINGYKVTAIGEKAFYENDGITSVAIPYGVKEIDDYAFYLCTGINSITGGENITAIGKSAFDTCKSITNFKLPNGVVTIGDSAFSCCDSLTSIAIPDSVTTIGSYAFHECDGLREVSVGKNLTSVGGTLFGRCDNLESVTLANGIKTIGYRMFYACPKLTDITIPDSVTTIEMGAFGDCVGLTEMKIPDNVVTIGENAFEGCTGITDITIPDSVKTIGQYAFYRSGLKSIAIGKSVNTIGHSAFSNCKSLTSIEIPSGVTSIGHNVFDYCYNLSNITVSGENANYTDIDGVLYDKNITTLIRYPIAKTGNSYIIPDSVKTIGRNAFACCDTLADIELPSGLTTVEGYAFFECDGLTEIILPDGVEAMGSSVFQYCRAMQKITIPNGVKYIRPDFYGCNNLSDIYYGGSSQEWESCLLGSFDFTDINMNYNCKYSTDTVKIMQNGTDTESHILFDEKYKGKTIVFALYDEGKLTDIKYDIFDGSRLEFSSSDEHSEIKILAWESISSIEPFCTAEHIISNKW
ncbi:MAG: leucine-rich repeat protein [Clostridia bacterium]|nr:leucine-rich repeat protein [Clostridia bacterium]